MYVTWEACPQRLRQQHRKAGAWLRLLALKFVHCARLLQPHQPGAHSHGTFHPQCVAPVMAVLPAPPATLATTRWVGIPRWQRRCAGRALPTSPQWPRAAKTPVCAQVNATELIRSREDRVALDLGWIGRLNEIVQRGRQLLSRRLSTQHEHSSPLRPIHSLPPGIWWLWLCRLRSRYLLSGWKCHGVSARMRVVPCQLHHQYNGRPECQHVLR